MGGAWVFPGGALADADSDPRWWNAVTLDPDDAERRLLDDPDPRRVLGLHVCALREAFEEVGFLLASGPTDLLERTDADHPARFLARCLERGIVLDAASLVPGPRWATPADAPLRFDARFFFARAAEGWEPVADPDEVDVCMWLTPAEALSQYAAGRAPMAPPTVETLQMLDGHADVAATLEAVRVRRSNGGAIFAQRLSPVVQVVLAPNPGLMTGPGTNTYVIGRGATVVIDPAVDDPHYLAKVQEVGGRIGQILVTHRHADHIGGARELQRRTGAPVRAFGPADAGGAIVEPLSEGDRVEVGSIRLATMHCPGHASDHLCFMLEGSASLFAGDNVLGEGTAVIAPPDGDMSAYMDTLQRLAELDIDRIYPGHLKPLDRGRDVIAGYIEHRRARERSIFDALERSAHSLTPEEIVQLVYTDVSATLHPVARFSVEAHLEMLRSQGRVRHDGRRWTAITAG